LTPPRARAITYTVVALLLSVALRFTPQLPERRPAEVILQGEPEPAAVAVPAPEALIDTLAEGESLQALLRAGGVPDTDVVAALRVATTLDMRRIPAGMPIRIIATAADAPPTEIVLQLAVDKLLKLRRTGSGWVSEEQNIPWTIDTVMVSGAIASTLYEAMDDSAAKLLPIGARRQLTWALADVFEYRVDMSRDLQPGDRFRVMAERSTSATGVVRMGNIVAASFELSGNLVQAIRFKSGSVSGDYFDQNGRSMRAGFLRAPVEFRRISSVFGLRKHPILGIWKRHTGTDYAANRGTPVRAVGDGTVIRAGWGGGYGNVLEIRHRNGYVTRYGHLRGFAKGIRPGTRVTIAQTVAYVGTTGLSTAPHLHFEVLVNGAQRDPRVALNLKGGDPIPSSERAAFAELRDRLVASLDTAHTGATKLAVR
jgi:murein DD-endopeptidase MepM/ murein hydrolase activator NlpD